MPIRALHGGVEFSVMQDKLGFENNVNVGLGYSFHLDLGGSTLGIGVAATLLNRTVDFSKLNPNNPSDPILQGLGEESAMMVDANLGLFWQMPESFYVGVSVVNILETMSQALGENSESSASFTTDRTFYAVAGYPFQFEDMPLFTFIPSVSVMSDIASTQLNASARVVYNNLFSLGVNYRPQESVGLMAGLTIKDITVVYSYDINTMGLGSGVARNRTELLLQTRSRPHAEGLQKRQILVGTNMETDEFEVLKKHVRSKKMEKMQKKMWFEHNIC